MNSLVREEMDICGKVRCPLKRDVSSLQIKKLVSSIKTGYLQRLSAFYFYELDILWESTFERLLFLTNKPDVLSKEVDWFLGIPYASSKRFEVGQPPNWLHF